MKKKLAAGYSSILSAAVSALLLSLPAAYEPGHFAKALFATSLCESLAWVVLLWLATRRFAAARHWFTALAAVLFVVETFTFLRFGSRLNPGLLTIVMQTDAREAWEFLGIYLSGIYVPAVAAGIAVAVWAYVRAFRRLSAFRLSVPAPAGWGAVALSLTGLFLPVMPLRIGTGNNTLKELALSVSFVHGSRGDIHLMRTMLDRVEVTRSPSREEAPVVVLVIGESMNRHHMSVYGYGADTTPWLRSQRESGNLSVFGMAFSPTNGTAAAMKYIFTHRDCCPAAWQDSSQHVLMPAVFRAAGYGVGYYDNQYTRLMHGELDYTCVYFLNPPDISPRCFDYRNDDTKPYDADFVEACSGRFMTSPKSLDIIHLKGQHADAGRRFPAAGFTHFTPDSIRRDGLSPSERRTCADYDNAILYGDSVMHAIADAFDGRDAVIVYLSDHGENLYDDRGHHFGRTFGSCSDPGVRRAVYEIPLMIWCSDLFLARRPDTAARIRRSTGRPFCLADVPYLLYDLAGIDFNYNRPDRSVIGDRFAQHTILLEESFPAFYVPRDPSHLLRLPR